jgi:hypothetical protein
LDFASVRAEQLRAKRDGSLETVIGPDGPVDQEVPGVGLTPAEAQELAALEQAQDNPSVLRRLYGFDQEQPQPAGQELPAPENQDVQDQTQAIGPGPTAIDQSVQPGAEARGPVDQPGAGDQAAAASAIEQAGQPVGPAPDAQPAEQAAAAENVLAGDERRARPEAEAGVRQEAPIKEETTNVTQAVEAQQAEAQGSEQQQAAAPAVAPKAKPKYASKEDVERLFGIDNKRQAALDRIAKGTAYFATPDKAKDFIKKNGLAGTHQVVQNGKRFEIVAKGAEPVSEKPRTEKEARAAEPQWWKDRSPAERYRILSASGIANVTAKTPWSKLTPEQQSALNEQWGDKSQSAEPPQPKTEKEAREQREAPGTRINGDVERKAADRLEQLYNQMGNITNRNSQEGNAKAAVRSVIEELRKPKTVVSVAAILDGAASSLDRNYGAFADVIREVSDSLGGDTAKATKVEATTNQAPKSDDFDAMFDDVLAEEVAKDEAAKPKTEKEARAKRESEQEPNLTAAKALLEEAKKTTGNAKAEAEVRRKARELAQATPITDEKTVLALDMIATRLGMGDGNKKDLEFSPQPKTEKEARAQRTATESLASAAKNTAAGFDAAIDGLGKLFGAPGRLSSGLTFDEETYAKAKPLFQQAIANLKDAGSDLREAMRTVIRTVLDRFGPQAAGAMKPYVVRFIEETAGSEKRAENAATATDLFTPEGKFKVAKEIADFLIGDGSFKTIIEARKKISEIIGRPIEAATELAKQADEAIETGVVLAGRKIVEAGRKQGLSPQVIYSRLVDLYNRQPNLSVRSSTSVRDQAYSTPVPLAYLASELAGITYESKVLEPTAGNGMLLVGAKMANSVANELNPKRAAMLDAMGFKAEQKNAATENMAPAKSQDAVIANPPFGVTKDDKGDTIIYEVKPNYGTREVDHAIAFKALATMKDNGRAVLIVGGVQSEGEDARREDYRGKSKRTFYFNLYNDYNVVDHFTIDGDLYSKQGASYPVDVIVIDGRGKSARDLPAADLPKIIRSYDELKEKLNGANGVESRAGGSTDGVGGRDGQTGRADKEGLGGGTGGPGVQSGTQSQPSGSGSGVRGNGPSNGGQSESGRGSAGAGQSESANAPQSGTGGKQSVSGDSKQQQSGRTGSNRANRSDSVGGSSVVAGERVESGLTDRRGKEQETETQVAYAPHSQASSVGTLVPKAMRDAIDASIQRIEDKVGDIDQYVADSLKMDAETLRANFSAEQVDALALAIDNAEAGKGFIIGDQTGIGKGRVVAAMIRYALVNGKTPIFVTEKPNLYSDMIRDLDDIGMTNDLALDTKRPRIFITNGGESIPYTLIRTKNGEVTETNLTLKAPKTGKALDEMMRDMAASDSLGEYRVIFTTYSQLQTVKGKATERQRFVEKFGNSNYMIFDESHNAGGNGGQQARTKEQRQAEKNGESTATGRASFVRKLVKNAYGTFFSSATYAKRPDVMDLYSSTNMSLAVDRPQDLADAITYGGVPMQQVVATMLTQDGQYIRRERTFAGVSYDTVETNVDKETAENMASAMRSILAFSRAKEAVIAQIQKEMDREGAMLSAVGGEASTVQGANFGSIMHNLIDQMLLSLKAQDSVNHAIERLKAGEKVVMTVSNTMGSFLQNYAEEMGLSTGDPVALSFADLYNRYLEKQRIVKIKSPNGENSERRLTDAELGPSLVAMFQRIKQQIADSGFGSAPISPIDYLHAELRKAGYKTDEITGRTVALNYSDFVAGEAKTETQFSFKTLEQGEKKTEWYSVYANAKPYQMKSKDFDVGKVIASDNSGSNRSVIVGRVKQSKERNDSLYLVAKNLKTGELFVTSPAMIFPTGEVAEVGANYQSELDGFSKARGASSAAPVLATRTPNIKQRVGAVRGFNNGDTDVLILNQAGSTGLSLHASAKFKDQRKRHMIVVQAEKNIDTHMQMLGRVHRTGQIIAPAYSQMMANIPAEMRPAAVLSKKMASLSANTTASRKSAVSAEGVVDFMNDYGDQVAQEYLRDNQEVHQAIGGSKVISLVEDAEDGAAEGTIRKLTGYIPILPIAQQETIYKDLIDRYNELLERENSLGTNKLEARALDLDAETIDSQPITEQKESKSVFASPAQMERVDVKRTVKPYSTAEVTDMVKERLGDKTAVQIANEAVSDLVDRTADYSKKAIEKMQAAEAPDPVRIETVRNQIQMALNIAKTTLGTYRIGDTISITDSDGQMLYGAITDIFSSGRTANPAAGSDWKMQIALANGDAKSLTLSFSQLSARYQVAKESSVNWYNAETQALEPTRVLAIFDKGATVRREKRWMVTGNILAGFSQYNGQIVSYTKKDGTIGQGVLMNRQFDFAKEQRSAPVKIKSADAAGKFFGATNEGATIGTPGASLRIVARGQGYTILVPSSKKEGGTYFLDSGLTGAIGGDFYKNGSLMTARNVTESQMRRVVDYLIKQREETLVALSDQDKAREMFAVQAEATPAPRQFNDLSVSPSFAFVVTPEPVRDNALAKIKSLQTKRAAGKITEAEYRLGVQQLIGKLKQRDNTQAYREIAPGRQRGARGVVAQLRLGVAEKTVPGNVADFAEWLFNQNPSIGNDLGISISGKDDNGSGGSYNPIARVANLFSDGMADSTAVHEILHHTERMMPVEVQNGIMKAWQRAWDDAYKAGDDKLKAALDDMLAASLGDQDAHKRTNAAFENGTLRYSRHYQLFSPSEFWAVNATRILSGRFAAKDSWAKAAIQWFKEFVQRAKAAFGLKSDAPVLKALEAVMRGEGVFQPGAQMLLERVDGASKSGELVYNDIVRNVRNNAVQFFGNRKDTIRTFGVYDKSLATQYHKALKDRDYGRVFNLSVDMQNAVSQVAIRPAELAAGILPRVDDVKSALKTALRGKKASKDLDGATKAIFAGTLHGNNVMEGKVFSDDELRTRFKLTDTGVALYKQARAAIDASLDEVAAAEAFAMAYGFIPKSLRAQILGNPQSAQDVLSQAIGKQVAMLKAAVKAAKTLGNETQQAQLESSLKNYLATERKVKKIFVTAKNLKAAGYAPLMRFGKYTVTVQAIDPATGEVLRDANGDAITEFFGQYETQGEAISVRNQKQADYKGRDDVKIVAGTKSQTAHELYAGVSPETLALFSDAIGAGEAMKKYYQLALSERSALKRRLERKGVAGFSEDMPRVLSNFITSNARFAAQRYYQRDLNNAIKFIPKEKGDVLDEAIALKQFMNNPNDPAAPVSTAMFAWFLGGSVASAIVNMTQPVMMTAPYLSQHGVVNATKSIAKAFPYAMGMKQITDTEMRNALKQASQEGIVDAQEIFHLYSVGAQSVASGLTNTLARLPGVGGKIKAGSESARARINAFLTLWGSMFSLAEGFNRKLTFIAAWEVAKDKGEADPYAFAVKAVNETQGIYNKVNRPNWARGPVGRTVLTFKQFSITYVELLSRMWKRGGPEGKRAALMMLAVLMLAAGEEGLPFAQDLDDLIDTIGQSIFKLDTNMRRNKRRLAYEILGKAGGDLFLYGISSQLPLDFAGRLGLGNLIPATAAAKPSSSDNRNREAMEAIGPAAGLFGQVMDAWDAWAEENTGKALQNLAPKAVKDVMAGLDMANRGYATDTKGLRTVDVTAGEAAIKAVGFNPTKLAQLTRKTMPVQQDAALQRNKESSILDQWVRGIADNDQAMIDKAQKRLDDWNQNNPDSPIVITASQLRARRRNMSLDKETRLLKAAPREMRGRVAEGLDDLE